MIYYIVDNTKSSLQFKIIISRVNYYCKLLIEIEF